MRAGEGEWERSCRLLGVVEQIELGALLAGSHKRVGAADDEAAEAFGRR